MLLHFLMGFLNGLLSAVYTSLPPWTITFGDGTTTGSSDGNAIHYMLTYIVMWDRFLPIHDFLLPMLAISFLIGAALIALKVFFKGVSFIPTIGAGG